MLVELTETWGRKQMDLSSLGPLEVPAGAVFQLRASAGRLSILPSDGLLQIHFKFSKPLSTTSLCQALCYALGKLHFNFLEHGPF